ncbi:hypothetical protein [Isoptericola aurantiacus]|uniref:hypothetical protein n=1 Tax=Isoptericola aurantiacus TaxID=3377839 RepID=UPI00383B2AAD
MSTIPSSADPRGADPRNTLVIVGGRSVTSVDADSVRAAAARLAAAADRLRAAGGGCAAARLALDRARWSPAPLGELDPGWHTRVRWALALAEDVAQVLGRAADDGAGVGDRLLRAAGLYTQVESIVERAVGAGVGVTAGVLGFGLTSFVGSPAGWPVAQSLRFGVAAVADGGPDPDAPRDAPAPVPLGAPPGDDGGPVGWLWRTVSPYADEAVAGAGTGVALGAPLLSGGDLSVTGGARVLSEVVRAVLGTRQVLVEQIDPAGFAGGTPPWDDRPAGDVAEALAATADLYPHGSGVPGRPAPAPPAGTIAVQEVTHADGSTSWTVLVPGTQALLSRTNPFDGSTDLDLMAGATADVAEGVVQALAAAGAAPGEPVVLVGHSLGGLTATALACSPVFRRRHPVGGVVTAGAPTATFRTPPGVPVLHLENTEELVSPLDGRSGAENPATADRVTVSRDLGDSRDPADRAASSSIARAHSVPTHLRTLEQATALGSVQVDGVVDRLDDLLAGEHAETRYYTVRRPSGQSDAAG